MSTQEEKELDDFIRKMVMDTGLEKSPSGLKQNIMSGLPKKYGRVVYTSLISKKGWGLVCCALLALVVFTVYNPLNIGGFFVDLFPWDLNVLHGSSFKTTTYAMIIFGIFMVLQVFLIKRRIDHRYRNH